jgi:hypothetical protein
LAGPDYPEPLVAAYAEAVKQAEDALRLGFPDKDAESEVRGHRKRFQEGKSYRDE